ncbi:HNH endonuclease [Escherichia coli]|nr:HNH endonuclease [Escherichia coli]
MPKPSPRIPPLEYQQEIKRRFTVNEKSQTGLDRDGHELCLKPCKFKYGSHGGGRKYKRYNKHRYYRVGVTANGKSKNFRVHNIVIWLTYGFDAIKPGYCVDHINRNGLDNRLANLRIVAWNQNMGCESGEQFGVIRPFRGRKASTKHKPRWCLRPVTAALLLATSHHVNHKLWRIAQ